MRPPFAYYGGKTTLAAAIVDLLPAHEHYVEPFAGSLAVLLAKKPAPMETVNDLDGDLVNFWRILRDQPDELAARCALTPHARAEHIAARAETDDDLERARRTWVLLAQGRAGTLRTTGWRHYCDPAGSGASMPGYLAGYVARMPPASARLIGVSLECRPALDVIESYGRSSRCLLYVDPPYVASTRNASLGYRHEMPHEDQHRELADALNAVPATVVLSGYRSTLYDEIYAGWHVHEISTWTGQGGTRSERTEVLWSNRPLAREATLFEEASASPEPLPPSAPSAPVERFTEAEGLHLDPNLDMP